ncbi:MAG: helix-turn-helix transcriptional regulator [Acidobacteriota bacterium]|nr:helix-turn-helix transcriptional regulator [Acidobacteriota bacterium]
MPTKNYAEISASRRSEMSPTERLDAATLDATLRLGMAVRDARDGLGISQTELANRLGVAQSAISRIEAGRTNVSVRTLVSIAAGLGLGLLLILGDQKATLIKEVTK